MISRLWNLISVGVGLWSISKTLKTVSENKNEMFAEFYSTLSPDEQKTWKKVFGVPPVTEVPDFVLPGIHVAKKEIPPIEKLEAGV